MQQQRKLALIVVLLVAGLASAGIVSAAGSVGPGGAGAGGAPVITDPLHHLSGVVAVPPAQMRHGGPAGGAVAETPPVFGPNVDATNNNAADQNETTIAINPENDQQIISAANDYRANLKPWVYHSMDGGTTWVDYQVPGASPSLFYGDPAMTFGRGGNAYFGYLGYAGTLCSGQGGMYVSRSSDAGATFTPPLTLASNSNDGALAILQDKDYVAVDNNPASPYSDYVYEGWTQFLFHAGADCGQTTSQISGDVVLSRSTDHGVSWSVPITASPPISTNNEFTVPAVGRHGEVYLYYLGAQTQVQTQYDSVLFSRSTDGGQTFPFFTHISNLVDIPSPLPHTQFRDNAAGAIAVDPQLDGYLYAVWADYRNGDADILFSRSTDNGATWGAPLRVNDDALHNGADQFFPWIATSPDGRVHVAWFDRREDPNNHNYKEYYADSIDHGASFEANVAVSTAPSNPGNSPFIGDYSGIAATSGVVMPSWTDIRSGNQNDYVARGVFAPGATPSPTATAASATPTPSNTPTRPPPTATATESPTPAATATCAALPTWALGPPHDPAREYQQGAVAADGKFYTAGGWTLGDPPVTNETVRFDPATDTWQTLAPMPVAEGVYGMAAAGNRIYVVGGSDIPTRTLTTTVQIYDTTGNTWSFGPAVPSATGIQGPAVAAVNGRLYVIGGADNNVVFTSTYALDLSTNTWSSVAPLPQPLFLSSATVVDGLIYLFGGEDANGNPVDTLYVYDPVGNTWTQRASAGTDHYGQAGGLTPYGPGRLLALDGADVNFMSSATTHIYDIATDTWTGGPTMNVARRGEAVATLPDGRVLVYAGGVPSLERPTRDHDAPGRGPLATSARGPLAPSDSSEILPPAPVVYCTPTVIPTRTSTPTETPAPTETATVAPSATPTATASPTPCTITFSDVHTSDYFYTPVLYLACHGVISGYADGSFRPYNFTTRAQMVKIVVLGFHIPFFTPPSGQTFADVAPSNPFFALIEAAGHAQIVSGYACGSVPSEPCDSLHRPYFRPNGYVTRGQLTKITVVAAGWAIQNPPRPTFTDVPPANPFYPYIETAVCHGIISGYADGTFRPYTNSIRGQIAKIVYGALTAGGGCGF